MGLAFNIDWSALWVLSGKNLLILCLLFSCCKWTYMLSTTSRCNISSAFPVHVRELPKLYFSFMLKICCPGCIVKFSSPDKIKLGKLRSATYFDLDSNSLGASYIDFTWVLTKGSYYHFIEYKNDTGLCHFNATHYLKHNQLIILMSNKPVVLWFSQTYIFEWKIFIL